MEKMLPAQQINIIIIPIIYLALIYFFPFLFFLVDGFNRSPISNFSGVIRISGKAIKYGLIPRRLPYNVNIELRLLIKCGI